MDLVTHRWRFAALALVAILAGALGVARAQLASPGDLAKAHEKLEGMGNCTKCHPAGKQLSAASCLDCHVELRKRVAERRGYHGRLGESDRTTCNTCHKEHEGRDFALVEWKPSKERFDHARTGWPLRGKHAEQKCATCHEPRRLVDADAQALKKRGADTFLGVGEKCATCHFDEHRGQMKPACEQCHTEQAWKPTPKFDHQHTDYPLAGKHRQVACAKCHTTETDEESHPAFPVPRATSFAKYKDIDHQRCTDCHNDPHEGHFGKNCEGCHWVQDWRTIKNTANERVFHDKTRYPLRGLHATVACVACHGPFPGRPAKFKGMTFGKCRDCHVDAHAGQLAQPACERCHSVDGWRPARFEVEEHAKTSYPLLGAHAAVACSGCHPQSAKQAAAHAAQGKGRHGKVAAPTQQKLAGIVLKLAVHADRCESCHRDPHAGQFRDRQGGCTQCHEVAAWARTTFNHAESRFPLTGKHAGVACAACHRPSKIGNVDTVRYRPLELACASCHADVHLGQLAPPACERCHTTADFKKTLFDHGDARFTTFALDGKHRKVPCERCHTMVTFDVGRAVRRYRPLPRECESCHKDFHDGQFKGFEP